MAHLLDIDAAQSLLIEKSVAVVCNAPEIFDTDHGSAIESHDLVLRMNRAWPAQEEHYPSIGKRTDILTGGIIGPLKDIPFVPPRIFWFKHTPMGLDHLRAIMNWPAFKNTQVFHAPRAWMNSLAFQFGYGPSSGPAAIATLMEMGAAKISVFGLSCWGELEPGSRRHWWKHNAKYKHLDEGVNPHNQKEEARWLRQRLKKIGPLWYEVA